MNALSSFVERCRIALEQLQRARQSGDPDAIEVAEQQLAEAMRRRVNDENPDDVPV